MTSYRVNAIGTIYNNETGTWIQLKKEFIPAITALTGFSHINVLWWFSEFDGDAFRSVLETKQPYKNAPDTMGIFATRSPIRPNPIALSAVEVIHVDEQKGRIQITYMDAHDQTPILDIKPYTPSLDRVETPVVPEWCRHWPGSIEASETFAWEQEFNF